MEILKKRVSRKQFLKICALFTTTIIAGMGVIKLIPNGTSRKGYGSGPYGG